MGLQGFYLALVKVGVEGKRIMTFCRFVRLAIVPDRSALDELGKSVTPGNFLEISALPGFR